jgi:hypothetical protein
MTTRLLTETDIFDVYGLEWVLQAPHIDEDDNRFISFRLGEIRDAYIHATKSRIRAEAEHLGINTGDLSVADMLGLIRDQLGRAITDGMIANADRMQRGGSFNLMGEILKAHQAAGSLPKGIDPTKYGVTPTPADPRPDVDPNWFMPSPKTWHPGRVTSDPRWADIAKAYLAIDAAKDNHQIISAIDRLNQLQHNSFHVLIDLQTGRMLTDYSNATDDRNARKRLQEILDIKLKARSPVSVASRMSGDVRRLLTKYRGATIQINDPQ